MAEETAVSQETEIAVIAMSILRCQLDNSRSNYTKRLEFGDQDHSWDPAVDPLFTTRCKAEKQYYLPFRRTLTDCILNTT